MKKADIIRDLTAATKQRKFAADFVDLFGYPFSEVQEFAAKDNDVNRLLVQYYEMIELLEQKLYFVGLAKGRFQNVLEKRLIKSGFIDISKIEIVDERNRFASLFPTVEEIEQRFQDATDQ